MKKTFAFLLFVFLIPGITMGQNGFEAGINAGAAFYNGDLGFFVQTGGGPATGIFVNYNFEFPLAVKVNLNYGMMTCNDKTHPESKLGFRSSILEYSVQVQYYITRLTKVGRNFSIKSGRRNSFSHNFPAITYVFLGVGNFNFNPQGKYTDGNWYNLQPLSTEGQGIIETRQNYSLSSMCVPIGFGAKVPVSRGLYLGFEMGFRKTFTDYLDDVSLTYINTDILKDTRGDKAVYFSNPSQNPDLESNYPAKARGNPKNKDAYMFTFVSLSYDFPKPRKSTNFKL